MWELSHAIEFGDLASVKSLILQKGVNPELGFRFSSPLVKCIKENNLDIAKFLIETGVNTCVSNEVSPLEIAIERRNLEMVKLLLDNGADMVMYQNLGIAIENNATEIVRELIKRGVDIHSSDGRSDFPLIFAVGKGNLEVVKLLIENGANVNVVGRKGDTPLTRNTHREDTASGRNRNYCEILEFLVENGADVNNAGRNGNTPIMNVVRLGCLTAMKYLIENRADLNARNAANETPLSIALSKVDFRTVKLLIESGADPDMAKNEIKKTAKKYPDFAAYMSRLGITAQNSSVGYDAPPAS